MFNLDGEVIGGELADIQPHRWVYGALSFAVPVDVVMNVYSQLRESGHVTRGWLGVLIQDVTRELAEVF